MNNGLLQVEELRLHYRTTQGVVQAVDGVTFSLAPRQALAVLSYGSCRATSRRTMGACASTAWT